MRVTTNDRRRWHQRLKRTLAQISAGECTLMPESVAAAGEAARYRASNGWRFGCHDDGVSLAWAESPERLRITLPDTRYRRFLSEAARRQPVERG